MINPDFQLDDRNFQRALRRYLDLRANVNPDKELKRRAKNIGMRLVKIYKTKGPTPQKLAAKIKSLGRRVKIRQKIRAKRLVDPGKWTHKRMIAAELRARKSSKGFTSTGWFPAIIRLGGIPRDTARRTGPRRGKLIERKSSASLSKTLVNSQPGAGYVAGLATGAVQQALDAETADMVKYIHRRMGIAARRNGL